MVAAGNIRDLLGQPGEWLRGASQDGDIVVSSRLRLARNLKTRKYLTRATGAERREIEAFVRQRLDALGPEPPVRYFALHELEPVDRQLLVERHLISSELANGEGERGVAVTPDETLSLMINEEDHLRLQVLRAGLNLDEAWRQIDRADRVLEQALPYAFHERYGYLTCCPTNIGTALRVSVMMHLPAAALSKQMDKVLQSLARLNFTVRGFFGEGTSPVGDLFQISNQVSLGKAETEIIEEMKSIIPQIVEFERTWRQKLQQDQPILLQDKIWRAFGTLCHCRTITSEETLELLSAMRLGVHLNVLTNVPLQVLNEIFIFSQPAHLQKSANRTLDPADRDKLRAGYIRERFKTFAH
jgi:protein arginine kinase